MFLFFQISTPLPARILFKVRKFFVSDFREKCMVDVFRPPDSESEVRISNFLLVRELFTFLCALTM